MNSSKEPEPPISETEDEVLPLPTKTVLEACSFANWYPNFTFHTFQSTIIPISSDLFAYLTDDADGLFLPTDEGDRYQSQLSDSDDDDASSSKEDMEASIELTKYPSRGDTNGNTFRYQQTYDFPQLNQQIRDIISIYGSVFPKLNWSAPQDSAFMLPSGDGLLRCRTPNDIYTLLKSSDCIAHDLNLLKPKGESSPEQLQAQLQCPAILVLREWFNLNPANEFRCFVRDRKLIAISSRSLTYFDYLQSPEVKQSIINRISDFFVDVVLHHFQLSDCIVISFASHPTLDSFQLAFSKKTNIDEILGTITVSFDVYLKNPTKSSSDHNKRLRPNLKVLDFNPLASYSDPYLFSFHELKSFNHFSSLPELRLVNQPGLASRFESSRIPIDLIYCSQGKNIAELGEQWQKMLVEGCCDEEQEAEK